LSEGGFELLNVAGAVKGLNNNKNERIIAYA
jgi:hypothetical protein